MQIPVKQSVLIFGHDSFMGFAEVEGQMQLIWDLMATLEIKLAHSCSAILTSTGSSYELTNAS